jgi:hypothetical protein
VQELDSAIGRVQHGGGNVLALAELLKSTVGQQAVFLCYAEFGKIVYDKDPLQTVRAEVDGSMIFNDDEKKWAAFRLKKHYTATLKVVSEASFWKHLADHPPTHHVNVKVPKKDSLPQNPPYICWPKSQLEDLLKLPKDESSPSTDESLKKQYIENGLWHKSVVTTQPLTEEEIGKCCSAGHRCHSIDSNPPSLVDRRSGRVCGSTKLRED